MDPPTNAFRSTAQRVRGGDGGLVWQQPDERPCELLYNDGPQTEDRSEGFGS